MIQLLPTIYFPGTCDAAINFYKNCLNAEIQEIIYLDAAPTDYLDELDQTTPEKFVSYSEVEIFGTTFVLTDGGENEMTNQNFGFTLFIDDDTEIKRIFQLLAQDGYVTEPLETQFWARLTGNVIDKFGVNWNILTRD